MREGEERRGGRERKEREGERRKLRGLKNGDRRTGQGRGREEEKMIGLLLSKWLLASFE